MLHSVFPDRRISAFTLIELLTVVVIVSLLASLTLGGFKGAKNRAAIARARTELAALASALEDYRRTYGDYPQLGPDGDLVEAVADPGADLNRGPGTNTVQAKLFNCLTGVFGPRGFTPADRQNGPSFLSAEKFTLEGTLSATFQVAQSNSPNPPFKNEENVALLDPWGRRYFYYYKSAGSPHEWQASSYILYSAGPDGKPGEALPACGIMTDTQRSIPSNADNLYAGPGP